LLTPGQPFELEAVVINNVWKHAIPAETVGDSHPVRVGVKGADANRRELEDLGSLGRLPIRSNIENGKSMLCQGQLSLPDHPELARLRYLKLDLLAEGAYWFESHNDIQSEPFFLPVQVASAAE
jgi:hypothetical protein